MPGSNVQWPLPLTRLTPWYPGQTGVPGGDSDRGLRQSCTGTIFWVDPNHVDNNDNRDGTNPESPLSTIGAALLKCEAFRGDVIAVMANNAWQYGDPTDGYATPIAENVAVNCPGVRIVGVHPAGSLGVVWQPTANSQTLITVNAVDVTIEGFIFDTDTYTGTRAIYALWDGGPAFGDNMTVRNCTFYNCAVGVQMEYAWYCDIHENIFHGAHALEYGIFVDTAGSGSAYNVIHGNLFNNVQFAIFAEDTDNSAIYANRIYNQVAANQVAAVADEGINLTGGIENIVSDNWLSCVLPAAANGDYDDFNTAGTDDAWINNHLMNGESITAPT